MSLCRLPPLLVVLAMAAVTVPATAQIRASAAVQDGPAPSPTTLLTSVPRDFSVVGTLDVDAALAHLAVPFVALGVDAPGLARSVFRNGLPDEFATFPIDIAAARSVAFGLNWAPETGVIALDYGAYDSTVQTAAADDLAFVAGSDRVVGYLNQPAELGDAGSFSLDTVWPAAAEALDGADLGWFYMADPILLPEIDREFGGFMGRAGTTRFVFGGASDASWTLVFDGNPTILESELVALRDSTLQMSQVTTNRQLRSLFTALGEAFASRLTLTPFEGGVILTAPPACTGVLGQFITSFAALAATADAPPNPATPATWGTAVPTDCQSEMAAAPLPWGASHVAGDPQPVVMLANLGPIAQYALRSLFGASAYPVDTETIRMAFNAPVVDTLLSEHFPFFATGQVSGEPIVVTHQSLFDAAVPTDPTFEVSGIGHASVAPPTGVDVTAPIGGAWQTLRDATPADAPGMIAVSRNALAIFVHDIPGPLRGATSSAFESADWALFTLDDGQVIIRLLGVDPTVASDVQTHIRSTIRDGIALADAHPRLPVVSNHMRGIEQVWVVSARDDGIEIRLDAEASPVFLPLAFLIGGNMMWTAF